MPTPDRLAFDKGTVRSKDTDGRLHVAIANISKAVVNGYAGAEIPDGEALGLDPDTIYYLLRDPKELAKGAETFNNLPLLSKHVPVSAEEPMKEWVVGSTGTDAQFDGVYLTNSLVVWDAVAIAGIESNVQKEISCGYYYKPVMTPGTFNGVKYDGVMTEIIGNHVALVEEGRAGPDVVVGDSKLSELPFMKLKSRKAVALGGALKALLRPKLAQDAKLDDLSPLLAKVTAKSLPSMTKALAAEIERKVKPKLAADADLSDLVPLLDAFAQTDAEDEDDMLMDKVDDNPPDPQATNKGVGQDDDKTAKLMAFLKGKLSDEDCAAVAQMMDVGATDADPDDKGAKAPFPPKTKDTPAAPDKKAMDAAIRVAQDAVVERMNAIREAEKAVAPFVGEIALQETPEAVYKLALDAAGVDLTGVPAAAYKGMVKMLPAPGTKRDTIAADGGSAAADFKKLFPGVPLPIRS